MNILDWIAVLFLTAVWSVGYPLWYIAFNAILWTLVVYGLKLLVEGSKRGDDSAPR